jgi:membrane associated rhomboid family serine protease
MKKLFRNFFSRLPFGARLVLLVYLLGFPLALIGHYTQSFNLYQWLDLVPMLVWKGQVWRVVSYSFLPGGVVDWALSMFWLVTLVSAVGKNWTSSGFLGYCLLGAFAGALPIVLAKPGMEIGLAGGAAVIFALLVAWDWFYRKERLILLGIGEISVRQAAILIVIINSLVLLFCHGWFIMLAMWCGGLAGRLWLVARAKIFMGKTAQQIRSERLTKLEL